MKTKRILTADDAILFFNTSINTMDDAIGIALVNINDKRIMFDYNAVSLLKFDGIVSDIDYTIQSDLFEDVFKKHLRETCLNKLNGKSGFSYVRKIGDSECSFIVKIEKQSDSVIKLCFICKEKLLDTENQLDLFSKVVGSGLSLFAGSAFWIDYDEAPDYFHSSPTGPKILGIDIEEDGIYSIETFQQAREKAKIVSEFYQESIEFETKSYQQVKDNETDFMAARTPVVTHKDDIVWVESYGKCIMRYSDGTPRLFIAIDIYMSEIYQEKTQLEILTNLVDYGLVNSDVGIWYHQKHFLDGKYYFTESYQKLMSNTRIYNNDSITDILDDQIELMIQDGNGYDKFLYEYREIHNSIFSKGVDKYHTVIPNYKDENTFTWIEVRGTVIDRDENGEVQLFVGVNVDVTESYLRNRELELLRVQNERLQLAENLAIKARNLMVWYQKLSEGETNKYIFGNEMFTSKLGIKRNEEGSILLSDLMASVIEDDTKTESAAKELKEIFSKVYNPNMATISNLVTKHRNLINGMEMYIEHSIEIADYHNDGSVKLIGGVLLDVTKSILYQEQIKYLADYDTLTDVNNRNYFENYIRNISLEKYTIFVFDVDGLKLINDVFGHFKGDFIISNIAMILKKAFFANKFICRIGGDEFAVLIEGVEIKDIDEIIQRIEQYIVEFNEASSIEMNISLGFATVTNGDRTFDKAFVLAENHMYRRKLNNRSSRKSKVLESILETLNAITEETKEHSERLADLGIKTMQGLGMTRRAEIEDIQLLARVHDIGKITIDDNILKKSSKLTDIEFELIKKHSEAGYKIIRNITDSDDVCSGVLLHHERWDGSGYPQGLKGEDIPVFARVLSVIDSFDAMTNDRVYRPKISNKEAIDEIVRCSGSQFDPKVVKAFLKACFDIEFNYE